MILNFNYRYPDLTPPSFGGVTGRAVGEYQALLSHLGSAVGDVARSVSPELAKTLLALQAQYWQAQKQLEPAYFSLQDRLTGQITGDIGRGLSPEALDFFRKQAAGVEAAAGRMGSPLSSVNIAKTLMALDIAQQQQNLANALNLYQAYRLPPLNIGLPGLTEVLQASGGLPNYVELSANLAALEFAQRQAAANAVNAAIERNPFNFSRGVYGFGLGAFRPFGATGSGTGGGGYYGVSGQYLGTVPSGATIGVSGRRWWR